VDINTYINANYMLAYGLEVTARNPVTKWLDLTTNVNFFNSDINTDNINSVDVKGMISYFAKMNAQFKLPKNYSIQLSLDYQSKAIVPRVVATKSGGGGRGGGGGGGFGGFTQTTAQGYVKPQGAVDLAIRKEFMKDKKASISLGINDIFKTRRYATYSESEFFIQEFERRQDWRVVRLNFNYRFGKFDATLFKRKNTRSGMEGGQDMQMQQRP
jgi:outer membrane receptor for ferrienterochelin and colicin